MEAVNKIVVVSYSPEIAYFRGTCGSGKTFVAKLLQKPPEKPDSDELKDFLLNQMEVYRNVDDHMICHSKMCTKYPPLFS